MVTFSRKWIFVFVLEHLQPGKGHGNENTIFLKFLVVNSSVIFGKAPRRSA
jgi:hypothetical protein